MAQPTQNPTTSNGPSVNPSAPVWNDNSPTGLNPNVNQVPGASEAEIGSKNAATGDEIDPEPREITNERQEGEWQPPGQDSFPGVENAPMKGGQDETNPAKKEDMSRRYV